MEWEQKGKKDKYKRILGVPILLETLVVLVPNNWAIPSGLPLYIMFRWLIVLYRQRLQIPSIGHMATPFDNKLLTCLHINTVVCEWLSAIISGLMVEVSLYDMVVGVVVMCVVPILTHQQRHCNDYMHCCLSCSTGRGWPLMGQTYPWKGQTMQPLSSHPHNRFSKVIYSWFQEDGPDLTPLFATWRLCHGWGWVLHVSGQSFNHSYTIHIHQTPTQNHIFSWLDLSI